MHKDPFVINLLLDMYESLLTDKQRTIMQLHYREDLSLAEISEELSISRATKALYEYEDRLHLMKQNEEVKELLRSLRAHVDEEGTAYLNRLEDLLS